MREAHDPVGNYGVVGVPAEKFDNPGQVRPVRPAAELPGREVGGVAKGLAEYPAALSVGVQVLGSGEPEELPGGVGGDGVGLELVVENSPSGVIDCGGRCRGGVPSGRRRNLSKLAENRSEAFVGGGTGRDGGDNPTATRRPVRRSPTGSSSNSPTKRSKPSLVRPSVRPGPVPSA